MNILTSCKILEVNNFVLYQNGEEEEGEQDSLKYPNFHNTQSSNSVVK